MARVDVRDITLKDLITLEIIHRENSDFPMPNLNNPLYFVKKSITADGDLIGAVLAHVTSEISLILDSRASKYTRSKAIKAMFQEVSKEIDKTQVEDTHVFVLPDNDEEYAKILMHHFGFVKASGIPLYLQKGMIHGKERTAAS